MALDVPVNTPFGLAFDPLGNLYSADCHSQPIYQLLEGSDYPHFARPATGIGFGPAMMDHDHGSTAIAGIAYYAAEQFPEEYRGNIFTGNVVTSRINRDSLEARGSTPFAVAEVDFVISQDPAGSRDFLTEFKAHLKQAFRQEEILIIEREIGVL